MRYLRKIRTDLRVPEEQLHRLEEILEREGFEVSPLSEVQAAFPEEVPKGTLILTDRPDRKDAPAVLGGEHGRIRLPYRYLLSLPESFDTEGFDPEVLEAEELERTYRRCRQIPWDISETERCLLRETSVEDLDAFYRIYADPEISAYMEDLFPDRAEEEAYTVSYRERVYELYGFGVWTVLLRQTGEVIGRAGISFRPGFEEPELGFLIGKKWQGQGLALEVCREILRLSRERYGFGSVMALVHPDNAPSAALCRKLGMRPEARIEEKNIPYDLYRYRTDAENVL